MLPDSPAQITTHLYKPEWQALKLIIDDILTC